MTDKWTIWINKNCGLCGYWFVDKIGSIETDYGYCFRLKNTDHFPDVFVRNNNDDIIKEKLKIITEKSFLCNKFRRR